jgi:hypothetical protein
MMSGDWPGLRQALDECADLATVCRARGLPGIEVFAPNEFYGGDRALKLYAQLPPDRPLKLVVPHGIVFNESYVWQAEAQSSLPAVFAYSDARARAYARFTHKVVFRSAVPFAYAARLIGASPAQRQGTLVFPGHSTHHLTVEADFEGMAEALLRLDARFQPVTVCIYWRDHELGRHLPFVERGFAVVSAGHIYDPAFLFRLAHLLSVHRYAASNEVGSSLCYSVIAGCNFFMLPDIAATRTGSAHALRRDLSQADASHAGIGAAFAEPGAEPRPRQQGIVAELAGLGHVLDRQQMRDCLRAAERLDGLGVAGNPQTGGISFAVPMGFARGALRLLAGKGDGK